MTIEELKNLKPKDVEYIAYKEIMKQIVPTIEKLAEKIEQDQKYIEYLKGEIEQNVNNKLSRKPKPRKSKKIS